MAAQGELLGSRQHKKQNPSIVYNGDHPPKVKHRQKCSKNKIEIYLAPDYGYTSRVAVIVQL